MTNKDLFTRSSPTPSPVRPAVGIDSGVELLSRLHSSHRQTKIALWRGHPGGLGEDRGQEISSPDI
jgi:hypothetical protein